MSKPVNKGDVLLLPSPSEEYKTVKIEWSQSLRGRSADYAVLTAKNVSNENSETVVFFAAEWYNHEKLSEVCEKVDDGHHFKLVVDSRCQYGQTNAEGEGRFIVYHDQSRRIFQHRFVQQLFITLGNLAARIGGLLGYPVVGLALGVLKNSAEMETSSTVLLSSITKQSSMNNECLTVCL